ncbi:NFACT RNA binding domain-containing protein [uncultured Clostridium sp.]|uniref:Rqc2 family fibronectin-binding protein n=1 Tax=uncultured Clostridium sp. TaxID=59620 RepID=UPI0026124FC4|nr:NFACT RNA binding domain-containing protein [uncultured Clostridium sp.]
MALDGIFLNRLICNLKEYLIDGKIDKINQPEKDEIILTVRKNRKNLKLLISASPRFSRIHLTTIQKNNPLTAPLFTMVLRKYLIGGTILDITQKDCDRLIELKISATDELGFDSKYSLIVEIMGRHSNITLVRDRDNKVMESIKHITPDINTFRVLYPGVTYVYPPVSTKLNPYNFTLDEFKPFVNTLEELNENFFSNTFTGISRPLSKELFFDLNKDNLFESTSKLLDGLKNSKSFYIFTNEFGILKDFHCINFSHSYSHFIEYDSPSVLIEEFFYKKDKQDRLSSKSMDLQRFINTNIERCKKKKRILEGTLDDCTKKETFKIYGDLLTSFIYSIKEGMKSITLQNFYSENLEDIEIPLSVNKTPSQNVQLYYKKYNKMKKAEEEAHIQLEKNEIELSYLNSVLTNIHNVDDYSEIDEIKEELMETGYLKFRKAKKNNNKKSKPLHFISSDGIDIFVGKNNIQNDYLSMKFAKKSYLWLHTKDIPGSHVIVCTDELLDKTIEEAATIAAYYSKAKNSTKVPVDYTFVKNLKKPPNSKLGMVIYHTNWTLYTEPSDFNKLDLKQI